MIIKELIQKLRPNFDFIFADLGYNLEQVYGEEYGMSYISDSVLDMRYDHTQGIPCHQILKTLTSFELTDILSGKHFYIKNNESKAYSLATLFIEYYNSWQIRILDEAL